MFTFYLYQLLSQSLLDLTLEPSVIHAGFYEGFYESFIPKIVLASGYFLFICISYLPKVFGSDSRILHDSYAVPLL